MQNCRQLFIVFLMLCSLTASARYCLAIPSQFGDTGLVSQPTAETLNSGNICVGIIGNCAENGGKSATVLPVFMTLGLGNFLEAYGSYPNILFNENEDDSGRGYSNIGFKIRVLGKRSSQFKLGLDGQLRRTVSGNINYDGLTDQVYRAIASYKNGKFGLHGNAGYIKSESPQNISYENQIIYGGGLEYLPNSRLRVLTEIGIESSKSQGLSGRAEVTAGFQYFLSPHLTLNIALAKGFSDESPNWRALFGFSSCQGIGTYQRPIPRKVAPQAEQPVEEKVEVKALKVRTLTPLSPKKKVAEPVKSSSKYEVNVGEKAEVVTLSPASAVSSVGDAVLSGGAAITAVANAPLAISSGTPLLQVAPEMAGSAAATALALPVNDALTLSPPRPVRSYKLNDVVKTDENQIVGKKIVEDLRYEAKFYSITETSKTFSATFFHEYDKPLDVWIEGAGKGNTALSQSKAAPYEEITLTVDKVNGKVPYFKLHLGELSEVFEFFPLRKSLKPGMIEIKIKPNTPAATKTIASTTKGTASSGGSSSVPALNSTVSVVGGASDLASSIAPEVEGVAASVSTSLSAGDSTSISKIAGPSAGKLTGKLTGPVPPKSAPDAEPNTVVPAVATTSGGATVIPLNSGATSVPGEITADKTITVRTPINGSLAAVPTNAVQAVAHKKFRLPSTVIFTFDDATLTEEGKAAITDVVEAITAEKRWYVLRVDGFTDSLGSDDYNVKLGLRRAIAVASYMVTNNGIEPSIIFVKSSGENDPIATNDTEEGRTLNRRAEIVLFVQKEE